MHDVCMYLWRGRVAVQARDQHGQEIELVRDAVARACDTSNVHVRTITRRVQYISRALVEFGFHI